MNCNECQEHLAAYLEGVLDPPASRECQTHLLTCPPCRAEHAAFTDLQSRLAASARVAAHISLAPKVMSRIRQVQSEKNENMFMIKKYLKWAFELGAAVGVVSMVLVILFGVSPKSRATPAEVMAKGAQAVANLSTIHMQCRLRTLPADNFAFIAPEREFVPIELWKQFGANSMWRIEKPGRVAVMDGKSTLMLIRPLNLAVKGPVSRAAFDTGWLHEMANLSQTLEQELRVAQARGWPLKLTQEKTASGATKSIVTVEAKSGLPDSDYLKNKFFNTSDTLRVYRFDDQTELLEDVKVYLHRDSGDTLIFEVTQITYNQPIDASVFALELPADVKWYADMPMLPDNEKYAQMTPQQAARTFFEACAKEDWNEVAKFWTAGLDERVKSYLGGMKVIQLGEPFSTQLTPAQFIPYEIQLKNGETKKWNLALKRDPRTKRWFVDGGL
jgi:hypothetical protein